MDTIFPNLENSKTSKPHVLKLKLTSKLDLRLGEKVFALSNLSIYYTWTNKKVHTITINLKYQHLHGMMNLITEVVLAHCNMVNNDYQQDSRVLYTFVPNKPFGSLLEISPTNHIFLKIFNSKYNEIEVWFTDQNGQPLETEDRINLTMVVE